MAAQLDIEDRVEAPDAPDVLAAFIRHLRLERGLSEHTIRAYTADIGSLLDHADRMGRSRIG